MKKFLLPLLIIIAGGALGAGAGVFLRPGTASVQQGHTGSGGDHMSSGSISAGGDGSLGHDGGSMSLASTDPLAGGHGAKDALDTGNGNTEFVKLNNQFIVPVIEDGRVRSMVVMSLAVETATGAKEQVYEREPVLRDKFLQVLFEHANAGRFDGNFTSTRNLDLLRRSLREEARLHFGNLVVGVLVTDIARQDV